MRVWKVSYHGGYLFSLVEHASPWVAVSIAKAHRKAKRLWSNHPPTYLDVEIYKINIPSAEEMAWCRKMGVAIQLRSPPRKRAKAPTLSDRGLRAIG